MASLWCFWYFPERLINALMPLPWGTEKNEARRSHSHKCPQSSDLNQVIWPPDPSHSHYGGTVGGSEGVGRLPETTWPPTPTHHIDEADGGLDVIGLGDHDLRGGEHLHHRLVLLQRHGRWVWYLDPDGEGAGLGVLLEHLWADTRWGEQGPP